MKVEEHIILTGNLITSDHRGNFLQRNTTQLLKRKRLPLHATAWMDLADKMLKKPDTKEHILYESSYTKLNTGKTNLG